MVKCDLLRATVLTLTEKSTWAELAQSLHVSVPSYCPACNLLVWSRVLHIAPARHPGSALVVSRYAWQERTQNCTPVYHTVCKAPGRTIQLM